MKRLCLMLMVAGCDGIATPEECAATPASECALTAGCETVRGSPMRQLAEDTFCLPVAYLFETVGCQAEGLGCDDVIVLADDPDGDRWYFTDSCIPADFTPTDLPDAEPCG